MRCATASDAAASSSAVDLGLDAGGGLARQRPALERRARSAPGSSRAPSPPAISDACTEPRPEQRVRARAPSAASSSPSARQDRPGGDDRVDAEVRPRAVRGAAARPRSPTTRSPCGRSRSRASVGSVTIAASARTAPQHLLHAEARVLLVGDGRDDHVAREPERRRLAAGEQRRRDARPSCRRRRGRSSRSPSTRGTSGSAIPSTPTVSRCPHSSSVRPPPVPRARTTTLGRPGVASSASTSRPCGARPGRDEARRSRASPAPPGDERRVDGVDRDQLGEQFDVRPFAPCWHHAAHERRARSGSLPAAPLRGRRRGRPRRTRVLLRISGELDLVSRAGARRTRSRRRPRGRVRRSTSPSWPSWTRPACAHCSAPRASYPDLQAPGPAAAAGPAPARADADAQHPARSSTPSQLRRPRARDGEPVGDDQVHARRAELGDGRRVQPVVGDDQVQRLRACARSAARSA